ncbi:hypothetical protein D3C84_1078310 [compost metagenome]
MKEELIEGAQSLQRRGVGRQAAPQAGQQLVDVAQHLLHVEFGVFVLCQADRSLEQGKLVVAPHERAEILQGGRCRDAQGHVPL